MASVTEPMNGDSNSQRTATQVRLRDELAVLSCPSSPGGLTDEVLLLHSKECSSCQVDEHECIWTTSADDLSCIRCREKGQPCVVDNDDGEGSKKRRKLDRLKCEYCRKAKQKESRHLTAESDTANRKQCSPRDRVWPAMRCERCIAKDLPCTRPQTSSETQHSNNNSIQDSSVLGEVAVEIRPLQHPPNGATQPSREVYQQSPTSTRNESSLYLNGVGGRWSHHEQIVQNLPTHLEVNLSDTGTQLSADPSIRTNKRSRTNEVSLLRQVVHKVQNLYKYTPLRPDEDMRLVVVQPAHNPEDLVKCKIVTSSFPSKQASSLRKCYEYQALSYLWGSEDPNVALSVVSLQHPPGERFSLSHIASTTLYIRPNLYNALRALRKPDQETILWIDALCINQNDMQEKTSQVSKMVDIFGRATSTCIWLGLDTGIYKAKGTFDFLSRILELREVDRIFTYVTQDTAQNCLAVIDLLANQWFSRRWIIQELALSRQGILHYGNSSMLWNDFADAVAIFMLKEREVKHLVMSATHGTVDLNFSAKRLIDATSNLFRKSNDGQKVETIASLEYLVCDLFSNFEASDPRDTIYAILSIAKDTSFAFGDKNAEKTSSQKLDPRVVPDYTATTMDTFSNFVDYCIESSKSLDILCRHWAPIIGRSSRQTASQIALPSWVSSIAGSPFGETGTALHGRVNGDSLVGGVPRRNYNASGVLQPVSAFKKSVADSHENETSLQRNLVRQDFSVLHVSGFLLGKIKRLSPRVIQGIVSAESLELCGWPNSDGSVPGELWRTLVADRGPDGTNPPAWYRRACLECLEYLSPSGDLNTPDLLMSPSVHSVLKMYLERVQAVIWNRKVFRTESGGILRNRELHGLGPSTTRENDLVCILFGCSVPVILRAQGPDSFIFVGEAYVHGMMDGEALELGDQEWKHPYPNAQVFKLI